MSAAVEVRRVGCPAHNCGGRCLLKAHVADGRIVRSGGKELALELESRGYAWLEDEVA